MEAQLLFADSCRLWTVAHSSVCCLQLHYLNPQGMKNLLQALDTDSRLDLLPTIWKGPSHTARSAPPAFVSVNMVHFPLLSADIKALGHDNKVDLVEELLSLMAREEHSVEVCFRPSLIHFFHVKY